MKKGIIVAITLLCALIAEAQESREVYSFLRLPVSAHAAALGGDNISITDDDPTVIFHNPSLIANVSDKSLNLNYMTYMEGVKTASASFVKTYKERATWGLSGQYMDYGSMKETTAENTQTGTFTARDIAIAGTLAYQLGYKFSGGITARFISSTIGDFSSAAVAVDLGANYYDEESGWSVSAVAKNLGGQIKAYDDEFERIPLDLQIGFTKRLIGSPLRISATMSRLNNWEQGLMKHLTVGADLILADYLYLAAGYNFRRSDEMKIAEEESATSHGAGLSLGGGIQLQRFKLQVGYAKYHVSASSLLVNVTYTL
ncbi:MAG: type IX secretion system protein PorQ [Prevotella sp.]|nr:type IX secretion system protein PorQ [Prevotella sp.]